MAEDTHSSHRGCVEDASNELEARLVLLNRAVRLGHINDELTESAYPLGFVGEPRRCRGRFVSPASRLAGGDQPSSPCRAPAIARACVCHDCAYS
eukprot:6181146-Pleurochrysis_carterae.AAC.6